MFQKGRGMGINYNNNSGNSFKLLKMGLYGRNTIVRCTGFFALLFLILNLILCINFVNKRNKSVVLGKNNTFVSYMENEKFFNLLLNNEIHTFK